MSRALAPVLESPVVPTPAATFVSALPEDPADSAVDEAGEGVEGVTDDEDVAAPDAVS